MVHQTIRKARTAYGLGLRELARKSGVSAAQISRIESGEVTQPSVDTLVSIARALNRNPAPLLIVSGHIAPDEARVILSEMFRPHKGSIYDPDNDSELVDEWTHSGAERQVEQARSLLGDAQGSEQDLRDLAAEVFFTVETAETLWRDSFIESLAHRAGDDDLIRLVRLWQVLPDKRRAKVLDYAIEQSDLAQNASQIRPNPRKRG